MALVGSTGCSEIHDRTAGCGDARAYLRATLKTDQMDATAPEAQAKAKAITDAALAPVAKSGPPDVRKAVRFFRAASAEEKAKPDPAIEAAHQTIRHWMIDDCGVTFPTYG